MAKKSKLLAALDAHKGKNHKREHQKKLQKEAEKKRKSKQIPDSTVNHGDENVADVGGSSVKSLSDEEVDAWQTDESGDAPTAVC